MRVIAVSLTGITAIFLASFTWTVLAEGEGGIWLGLFLVLVVPATTALLAGRLASSGRPAVAGAVVALLSFITMLYGRYLAYLTGLGGLDVSDFGGGDMPPEGALLLGTVYTALPILVVGAVLGVVGTIRR